MCLVQAWNTRLLAKTIADELSKYKGVGVEFSKLESASKRHNQIISVAGEVRAPYFALVEERATVAFILTVQDMSELPKNVQ